MTSRTRKYRTGQPGWDNRGVTSGTRLLGQTIQEKSIWTGRPDRSALQVSLDRKDRTDQDMTARKDMGVRRTVDKVVLAGHLEQDSWDRTAGT
jgi:hypothetical protein